MTSAMPTTKIYHRPGGTVETALLAIFQFSQELLSEADLVRALKAAGYEQFPRLLRVVLNPETKEKIADGYSAAFGSSISW